jgi:hypothetical protein
MGCNPTAADHTRLLLLPPPLLLLLLLLHSYLFAPQGEGDQAAPRLEGYCRKPDGAF